MMPAAGSAAAEPGAPRGALHSCGVFPDAEEAIGASTLCLQCLARCLTLPAAEAFLFFDSTDDPIVQVHGMTRATI